MAGSVEHMAVAVELLREDQRQQGSFLKLKDPVHFVLGNLAPDGIMSRKGYVRSMKMHTHFRDGIPDWEFTREDHQKVFHQRIRSFCAQMLSEPALDRDLYLGYVTHILTDEIFMKTVRPEFMAKIAVLGLTDRDAKTFEYFTYDVNQIDFKLGREYPGMHEMKECLLCEDICSIRDMITQQELADSREWVRNFFFDQAPMPEQPLFYTYERALGFIREAVLFIKEQLPEYILSEDGNIGKK